jgi:hypothetical protein
MDVDAQLKPAISPSILEPAGVSALSATSMDMY